MIPLTSIADPAIAQDVARASAAEAGTAPADTIGVACSLVRAGVFFDGTGNSRNHVPVEGGDVARVTIFWPPPVFGPTRNFA